MPRHSNGPRFESLTWPRLSVVAAFLAAAAVYFYWRIHSLNPQNPVFSALLFAAELYGFVTALLHVFMTWRVTDRQAPPAPAGLSVDVFVPTYNESPELVRRTLLAALEIDYPHQVWLLDDGDRPAMAALAREMGCRYLSRTQNTHAKAGSLNNALRHSQAEFVAIFDADHAPARAFLDETLGYFDDGRVAFVQTPQDFFNLDSYQHRHNRSARVWTEQSLFFRVIQRGKDYWNSAFFCGSCAVIRRSALDRIGGFATGSITEDLHTSLRLHKAGFRSVYHAGSLAFGIAPPTIVPFLKQRIRWGQGAMQVWRQERVVFTRGLTVAQRLNYIASMLTYFDGWQKGFLYLAPAIVLTTGWVPIAGDGGEFLVRFVPYFLLTFWVFEEVGRGYGDTARIEQYNFARFWAFAWATLGLFKRRLRFKVTDKAPTGPRGQHYLLPQWAVVLFSAIAVPSGLALYFLQRDLALDALLANLVWVGINALIAVPTLRFTKVRADSRRGDYRFPIPLPASLRIGRDTPVLGTIDDISSSGFRFYAQLPADPAAGSRVEGHLYLPSGPLHFRSVVAAAIPTENAHGERYVKAIGCRFEWTDQEERDRLDAFLYGSDLQWHVREMSERIRTPLEWLADVLRGKPNRSAAPTHWSPAIYYSIVAGGEMKRSVGLVGGGRFIAFERLPAGNELDITVVTRTRVFNERLRLAERTVHQSGAAPVCGYRAEVLPERGESEFMERKPLWLQEKSAA